MFTRILIVLAVLSILVFLGVLFFYDQNPTSGPSLIDALTRGEFGRVE